MAFASSRLSEYGYLSDPTKTSGKQSRAPATELACTGVTGKQRQAYSVRRRTVAPRHSRRLCAAAGTAPSPFLEVGEMRENSPEHPPPRGLCHSACDKDRQLNPLGLN